MTKDKVITSELTVNTWKSADQELKLSVIEDLYQLSWDEIIESSKEGIHLCLDGPI